MKSYLRSKHLLVVPHVPVFMSGFSLVFVEVATFSTNLTHGCQTSFT